MLAWISVAHAFDTPTFVRTWGSPGSAPGQFSTPQGIAADDAGAIYVVDIGNCAVQKFDSTGAFLLQWGTRALFNPAVDIAVGPSGNPYVANEGAGEIDVFSPSGVALSSFGSHAPNLGSPGGTFYLGGPNGIAFGPSGHIFVSDQGNGRVHEFDASGTFVRFIGYVGSGAGRLASPGAIAVASDGTIYVADEEASSGDQIQVYDANGGPLRRWGTAGSGPGQFSEPRGLAIDAAGNVYVADGFNSRVEVFTALGTYLGQWGSLGSSNGQFSYPDGIAIVGSSIYVLDSFNNRVQQFSLTPVAAIPTSWGKVKAVYH